MKKILLILFFFQTVLFSITPEDINKSNQFKIKEFNRIDILLKNNIWIKTYLNYELYKNLKKEELDLLAKIKKDNKNKELKEELASIIKKIEIITDYQKDPFKRLIVSPKIDNMPTIDNPITIIEAISFKESLEKEKANYLERYNSLIETINNLKKERNLIKNIFSEKTLIIDKKITSLSIVLEIFNVTRNEYFKRIDEINISIKKEIKKEISKTIDIGIIILFLIIVLFVLKFTLKKVYIENERFYIINKLINILFSIILIITILFSYIENIDYIITILGFASAGIAIAMKDWFMSLMGWFVIIIGNSIHVGDRVKFVEGNNEYVGDIIDISLLRISIQEDITLTTVTHNRRAGRIIFVPNNYIFTNMIANYSHSELKTVWDGIDITLTFDSDINKANSIIKGVIKKYSKGYTDNTRKQINKMRGQYNIKNLSVEPRVYSSIEQYGVKISAWYLTNSFATLTLRTTISIEIINELKKEDNIKIAYPTQTLILDKERITEIIKEET